ncbi:hypothetical protein LXL04_001533 [Taraxacum kok-saghyz]
MKRIERKKILIPSNSCVWLVSAEGKRILNERDFPSAGGLLFDQRVEGINSFGGRKLAKDQNALNDADRLTKTLHSIGRHFDILLSSSRLLLPRDFFLLASRPACFTTSIDTAKHIHDGNKSTGGLRFVATCYGIVGKQGDVDAFGFDIDLPINLPDFAAPAKYYAEEFGDFDKTQIQQMEEHLRLDQTQLPSSPDPDDESCSSFLSSLAGATCNKRPHLQTESRFFSRRNIPGFRSRTESAAVLLVPEVDEFGIFTEEDEEDELVKDLMHNVQIIKGFEAALIGKVLSDHNDQWVSRLAGDGQFHVADLRGCIDGKITTPMANAVVWIHLVPLKVMCFIWRTCINRIPTATELSRRGILVNLTGCPLCMEDVAEEMDHLFLGCSLAKEVLVWLFSWCNISIQNFQTVEELVNFAAEWGRCPKKRKILLAVLYGAIWNIWKARNDVIFNKIPASINKIKDNILTMVFGWIKYRGNFGNCTWAGWCVSPFNVL